MSFKKRKRSFTSTNKGLAALFLAATGFLLVGVQPTVHAEDAESSSFSITTPTKLILSATEEAYIYEGAGTITNNSDFSVSIEDVSLNLATTEYEVTLADSEETETFTSSNWSLVSAETTDFSELPIDSNNISFELLDQDFSENDLTWDIEIDQEENLDVSYKLQMGPQSSSESQSIGDVTFIFSWEDFSISQYLTLTSDTNFSLATYSAAATWNGDLYYSVDEIEWSLWDGTSISSSDGSLYLAGEGNSVITGGSRYNYSFVFTDATNLVVDGNIETLLDWKTVAEGNHPEMGNYCYSYLFYNCTSLISAPELPAETLSNYCYSGMFYGCTALTNAPELLSKTLANYCYSYMFCNCTALTNAPELLSKTLANYCYSYMFCNCTALTNGPSELPATETSNGAYSHMFYNCKNLLSTPRITDIEIVGDSSCWSMFNGCISLTTLPNLSATTVGSYGYYEMFYGCTGIMVSEEKSAYYTVEWIIPSEDTMASAGSYWSYNMLSETGGEFTGSPDANTIYYLYSPVSYLTLTSDTDFDLSANNLSASWNGTIEYSTDTVTWTEWDGFPIMSEGNALYLRGTENTTITNSSSGNRWCFNNATNLAITGNIENLLDWETVAAEEHPEMDSYCFAYMFYNCTSLVVAPDLLATTLAEGCYSSMFYGCSNLVSVQSELPASFVDVYSYSMMYYLCTSLELAPELPATEVGEYGYYSMFQKCTSLVFAPSELPAETVATCAYRSMFFDCTSLVTTPDMTAATSIGLSSCRYMFSGCSNLTEVSDILADIVYEYGCYQMFNNCTSLLIPPSLTATTICAYGYKQMFNGCTGIMLSTTLTGDYTVPWLLPSEGEIDLVGADGLSDMFAGTSGTFTGTATANTTYYLYAPITYLAFTSDTDFAVEAYDSNVYWDGTLYYSTDTTIYKTWTVWDGTPISSENKTLYIRGEGNTRITGDNDNYGWKFTDASNLVCSGSIENLLDWETVSAGEHPTMASYCFRGLFSGCTSLVKAPDLTAITLSSGCYERMFYQCSSLTVAPDLPAATLASWCYFCMFASCTSLAVAPELPVTTLAYGCYNGMFFYCINLSTAPALPATTLAGACYSYMFSQCTSLTSPPVLPATTLATMCYEGMFYGCTGIKVSEDATAEYSVPWTITDGEVEVSTDECYWNYNMLYGTGGTFTGDPSTGITYYLSIPTAAASSFSLVDNSLLENEIDLVDDTLGMDDTSDVELTQTDEGIPDESTSEESEADGEISSPDDTEEDAILEETGDTGDSDSPDFADNSTELSDTEYTGVPAIESDAENAVVTDIENSKNAVKSPTENSQNESLTDLEDAILSETIETTSIAFSGVSFVSI